MKVSVVIPTYNTARTIDFCLTSVLNQGFSESEVIVVDGGSTDGTIEKIKRYSVKLIGQSSLGLAAARNAGAEISNGDVIIFLDGDCIASKNLIRNMVEPFHNKEIGMTQGYIDIANPDSLVARLIFKKARYVFRDLEYLNFVWTGCVAIRRKLFEMVGKFDESVRFVEDDELAYRVVNAGYKIYLVKNAKFFHHFPMSSWRHLKRQAATARWMVRLIRMSGRFTSKHGSLTEYSKLVIHSLTLLSFPLLILEEIPFIVWEEIPVLVLFSLSLITHLKLARWAMKEDLIYVLLIPFEFLTKMSWVFGSIAGLTDVILKKTEREL